MKKILVIGASGFIGKAVAQSLLADGYQVRCLARNPDKIQDLAKAGCEIAQGDILDLSSMQRASKSVDAVYIAIHTLSPQNTQKATEDFMDIEIQGLRNIVTACQSNGVHRVVYVTFLGTDPNGSSSWTSGRWQAEQLLLKSGLDVTVIRPGMIVGVGGQGFAMLVSNAKKRFAFILGSSRKVFRCIAIDDLVYFLVGVLTDQRTYGQGYDVGSDDVLTNAQMIDTIADVVGQPHPIKFYIPLSFLSVAAPLIERLAKLPKNSMKGMFDSFKSDMIGNPEAIRRLLNRPLLSFRQAVEKAL